jgi:peptidoglycan/xylan/chitin deacetylase (PgdA/CDA1 family)
VSTVAPPPRSWRSRLVGRRRLVGAVLALAALVVGVYGVYVLMNARSFQLAGDIVSRVNTTEPVVALTFDDGPVAERVDPILVTLRQANVRATFYVIGEAMAQSPESARQIVAAGHELGNHSYTHDRMVFRSAAFYSRELEQTETLIRASGYTGLVTFRPPFGKKLLGLPLYLAQTGRTSVTWSVEPESDPATAASADAIVAHVLERTRPGSIVLLHPWYASGEPTRQAIRPIVAGLRERGYRFVTISELLALTP